MSELSIGILSVGSPQFEFAVKSVENQTLAVPHFVIQDVSPFAASFNQMLTTCETPYVIQLDEDMELYPESAQRMLDTFKHRESSNKQLAQLVFRLADPKLGEILGVKIYSVEKAREVTMAAGLFPDRDFNEQLEALGYITEIDDGEPAGSHARHRTDYEWFLKLAVSASKVARPHAEKSNEYDPAATDLRRFLSLFNEYRFADTDDAIRALGGLFWGLFHDVRTDTATYPSETYEKLQQLVPHIAAYDKTQRLHDLIARSNAVIASVAETEHEPVFYCKENYYGRGFRTALSYVLDTPYRSWDLVGLGFAEMAVALQELGYLRSIYIDSSSRGRLKNPVTASINERLVYSAPEENKPTVPSGLMVANGTKMPLFDLVTLIVENYPCAIVDLAQLEKNKLDSVAFMECMRHEHQWALTEPEDNIICLQR